MTLDEVKAKCKAHHDQTGLPMRWWNGSMEVNTGCFGGAYPRSPWSYTVFHGDGVHYSWKALTDVATADREMAACEFGFNELTGTPRSREWLEYLLSPESPWAELVPFLAEPDLDYINNAGFIWKDGDRIPQKLWYNFIMAGRYPWDMPVNYEIFRMLRQEMHPNKACFIASNFVLASKAKDIAGPWIMIYPWGFLEQASFECAGRFILGRPANKEGERTPNVFPLWKTEKFDPAPLQTKLDRPGLALPEIIEAVDQAVSEQKVMM